MEYHAFISYRRSDGSHTAHWLRRELQRFRPPRRLASKYPGRLQVYLDTAYERATSDFYSNSIRPALLASRYLIVLATPQAAARGPEDWIVREVDDFIAGPNGTNIAVARAAGPFDGPLPANIGVRFPTVEVVDLTGVSRLWFLHPTKAGRIASEKLKLVAPLLNLAPEEMPILRQEEERALQVRIGAAAGMALAVVLAVAGLSIFALQSQYSAWAALDDSMFATGRVISDVASSLSRSDASRAPLMSEACDLIDKLAAKASNPPPLSATTTCAVERALAWQQQGDPQTAQGLLTDAIAKVERQYASRPTQDTAEVLASVLEGQVALAAAAANPADVRSTLADAEKRSAALIMAYPDDTGLVLSGARLNAELAAAYDSPSDAANSAAALDEAARLAGVAYSAENDPDTGKWQVELLLAIAATASAAGDTEHAIAADTTALMVARDLISRFPNDAEPQLDAAEALVDLAQLDRSAATPANAAEARADLNRADAARDSLTVDEDDQRAALETTLRSTSQSPPPAGKRQNSGR